MKEKDLGKCSLYSIPWSPIKKGPLITPNLTRRSHGYYICRLVNTLIREEGHAMEMLLFETRLLPQIFSLSSHCSKSVLKCLRSYTSDVIFHS